MNGLMTMLSEAHDLRWWDPLYAASACAYLGSVLGNLAFGRSLSAIGAVAGAASYIAVSLTGATH